MTMVKMTTNERYEFTRPTQNVNRRKHNSEHSLKCAALSNNAQYKVHYNKLVVSWKSVSTSSIVAQWSTAISEHCWTTNSQIYYNYQKTSKLPKVFNAGCPDSLHFRVAICRVAIWIRDCCKYNAALVIIGYTRSRCSFISDRNYK